MTNMKTLLLVIVSLLLTSANAAPVTPSTELTKSLIGNKLPIEKIVQVSSFDYDLLAQNNSDNVMNIATEISNTLKIKFLIIEPTAEDSAKQKVTFKWSLNNESIKAILMVVTPPAPSNSGIKIHYVSEDEFLAKAIQERLGSMHKDGVNQPARPPQSQDEILEEDKISRGARDLFSREMARNYGNDLETINYCASHFGTKATDYSDKFCAEKRVAFNDKVSKSRDQASADEINNTLRRLASNLTNGFTQRDAAMGQYYFNSTDKDSIRTAIQNVTAKLGIQPKRDHTFFGNKTTYQWAINSDVADRLGIERFGINSIEVILSGNTPSGNPEQVLFAFLKK